MREPIDVSVIGLKHHGYAGVKDRISIGTVLNAVREPDNPHDPGAIAIRFPLDGNASVRLGYAAMDEAAGISARMDAGEIFDVVVSEEPGPKGLRLKTVFTPRPKPAPTPKRDRSGRARFGNWL